MTGHRLGALEEGGGVPPSLPMHPWSLGPLLLHILHHPPLGPVPGSFGLLPCHLEIRGPSHFASCTTGGRARETSLNPSHGSWVLPHAALGSLGSLPSRILVFRDFGCLGIGAVSVGIGATACSPISKKSYPQSRKTLISKKEWGTFCLLSAIPHVALHCSYAIPKILTTGRGGGGGGLETCNIWNRKIW